MHYKWRYDTPLGTITVVAGAAAIVGLYFEEQSPPDAQALETPLLRQAGEQLREYFAGTRRDFDLPLAPCGTPFQRADWQALRTIPYGQIRTYGQIAAQLGRPKACRAVGLANRRNPISIFIPCHRVIGANGKLVGYGGGLARKEMLLALEQKFA